MTSWPYWALRNYGIEPAVWGGDAGCEHVWGELIITHHRGPVGGRPTLQGGPQAGKEERIQKARHGQFCARCGAWLGNFGLEPSPELYIEHGVEISREVQRVLRDDGTYWLNLGDCHAVYGEPDHWPDADAVYGIVEQPTLAVIVTGGTPSCYTTIRLLRDLLPGFDYVETVPLSASSGPMPGSGISASV